MDGVGASACTSRHRVVASTPQPGYQLTQGLRTLAENRVERPGLVFGMDGDRDEVYAEEAFGGGD